MGARWRNESIYISISDGVSQDGISCHYSCWHIAVYSADVGYWVTAKTWCASTSQISVRTPFVIVLCSSASLVLREKLTGMSLRREFSKSNRINGKAFFNLNDSDLQEIVAPLGDRKAVQRIIFSYCGNRKAVQRIIFSYCPKELVWRKSHSCSALNVSSSFLVVIFISRTASLSDAEGVIADSKLKEL